MGGPTSLTVLPTYRCTAACRECCFESSPHIKERGVPPERILSYIDEAAEAFRSTLKLVVFSGGECFLLGKNLDRVIANCAAHGLMVRCVTNGYWATTPERAAKRMADLKAAGLTELNISTGDEHQQWVPFDRVVNGVVAAAEQGVRALIVVEGSEQSNFTLREVLAHPRIVDFAQHPNAKLLNAMSNIWMPFHNDHDVTQTEEIRERVFAKGGGCRNLFDNVVVTPHEQLASCCGLTFEHIPELKLGSLRENRMGEMYASQYEDFMKVWIALDGPHKIWLWAREKDPAIELDANAVHICHACAVIYQNPKIRHVLEQHYREKVTDVMFRFQLRENLAIRSDNILSEEMGFAA